MLLGLLLASDSVDPPVPVMPDEISQKFSLSDGSRGEVFYDYRHKQQRINHINNTATRQNQCFFWYNTTFDCTEYFTDKGEMWVDIPGEDLCCLESCSQGCRENTTFTPRPDFADACDYKGLATVQGRQTKWYSCPCTFDYYITPDRDIPVLFETADKNYVVSYDVDSFAPAAQPSDLFKLPSRCKAQSQKCSMKHPLPP